MTAPFSGHAERMDRIYRLQRHIYDATRLPYLLGRRRLIDDLRPPLEGAILEIGCGTGMVLYRVAPKVEHYTAVDLSPHALETIRAELTPEESAKVVLLQQAAHELNGVADRSCDTVVINSVAQYFPDSDYLIQVLKRASELVEDGGRIFVGDVRSRDHLEAFQTLVALHQAPGHLDAAELAGHMKWAGGVALDVKIGFSREYTDVAPRTSEVDCDR